VTDQAATAKPARSCPVLAADTAEFAEHFYTTLAQVGSQSPIAWDETHERAFVVGYDAASRAAKDWRSFSSAGSVSGIPDSEFRLIPVESDPPVHKQWRDVLMPWFSPGVAAELSPLVRGTIDELIDQFVHEGNCEAVEQIASPLPAKVLFQHVLHLPTEDLAQCEEYVRMFVGADMQGRMDAVTKLGLYAFGHVQNRRQQPPVDDLIGAIIAAEIDGQPVDDGSATSVIVTLIVGALETTKSTLASTLLHFATHPVHQAQIAADRALLPAAVEECLRLYTPATYLVRQITTESELHGVRLSAGEQLAISFAAGSRDPAMFDEPTEYRLDRPKNRHLGFGVGIHYCVGAHLARAMLIAALDRALDRMPSWRLAPDFTPAWEIAGVRSLEQLRLVFDAPS
jgi:cytochrome P450